MLCAQPCAMHCARWSEHGRVRAVVTHALRPALGRVPRAQSDKAVQQTYDSNEGGVHILVDHTHTHIRTHTRTHAHTHTHTHDSIGNETSFTSAASSAACSLVCQYALGTGAATFLFLTQTACPWEQGQPPFSFLPKLQLSVPSYLCTAFFGGNRTTQALPHH
jgi:hypothetical protein